MICWTHLQKARFDYCFCPTILIPCRIYFLHMGKGDNEPAILGHLRDPRSWMISSRAAQMPKCPDAGFGEIDSLRIRHHLFAGNASLFLTFLPRTR